MSYVRTEEEAKLSVRALIKYLLEEDPDPVFAEERIMVMIQQAYKNGRADEIRRDPQRYNNVTQTDFRILK